MFRVQPYYFVCRALRRLGSRTLLVALGCAVFSIPSTAQTASVQVREDRTSTTVQFDVDWPSSLPAALDSAASRTLSRELVHALSRGELYLSRTVPVQGSASVDLIASEFDEVAVVKGGGRELVSELESAIASLESVGWHRRRLVGSVTVRLIAYDQAAGKIRRYRRLVVRVSNSGQVAEKFVASGVFTNPHLSVERSVLADGRVFKVPISTEGVFRIDRSFVAGIGLDPNTVDPNQLKVFSNGGAPLPALNSDPRKADLSETPVLVVGGGDGSFGQTDAVFFYANGPNGWRYDAESGLWTHYVHPFSVTNYVFVKLAGDDNLRVSTDPFPGFASPTLLDQTTGRHFVDTDVFMWSKEHGSGHTWVSNPIQAGGRLDVMNGVTLPGFMGGEVTLTGRVAVKSNPPATVRLSAGSTTIGSITPTQIVTPGAEQPTAVPVARTFTYSAPAGPVSVSMVLLQQANDPQAALDWLRLEYAQQLTATEGAVRFCTPSGAVGQYEFALRGFATAPRVFDVSDPADIRLLETRQVGDTHRIQVDLTDPSRPREFMAWNQQSARLLDPELAAEVPPQNLHGMAIFPDFVIVAPAALLAQANELADIRRTEGLDVIVAEVSQIYNEFSGGLPDMRAIRDFFKFLYDRAPDDESLLRYVLLLGDGHYDFRNLRAGITHPPNHILPYETEESFHPDRSFTSDDYFGLLDDNEGEWVYRGFGFRSDERVDIGIGRIPVGTVAQAGVVLDKIKRYESGETFGPWRGVYTFIADDAFTGATGSRQENDLHLQNIDSVAELVREELSSSVNPKKIYGESFERVFLNEVRLPDAHAEILKTIDSGTLVVNYAGHGGPSGLAQEDLFTREDAIALTNRNKLPVFITATCSFGWWDIDDFESGAEALLNNPNGGAVATLTTVRLVYTSSDTSSLNPGLNRALNREMFKRDDQGRPVRLGDAMIGTKNTAVGLLGNSRKFNLLGDPTMRLGLPSREAIVEDVNGVDVTSQMGRLPALERVTLTGSVRLPDGTLDSAFEGRVDITVFDALRQVPIRYRTFQPTPYYLVREDLIWRGSVRAQNGTYSATFVVPKDISYSNDFGRISVYAAGGSDHALGSNENLVVGGTSANPPNDAVGPQIDLFLNDTTFVSGGLTHPEPSLIVKLSDDSGINTVGAGVGHELLLVINDDEKGAVSIGSAFQSDENSYQRGSVEWKLPQLDPGPGTVSVRAWDVLNNSSTETLEFVVAESSRLTLRNVYNYPNPTSGRTRFIFEHNQPSGTQAEVRIRIYTLNGRPIRTMEADEVLPSGFLGAGPVVVEWDGRDDDRDRVGTGIYLYQVRVEISGLEGERQVAEQIEKLAVIR